MYLMFCNLAHNKFWFAHVMLLSKTDNTFNGELYTNYMFGKLPSHPVILGLVEIKNKY